MKSIQNKTNFINIVLVILNSIFFILSIYLISKVYSIAPAEFLFTGKSPAENIILKKYAHIDGAILNPGIYEFEENERINNLIKRAGGITNEADIEQFQKNINISEKLKDEQKIFIPFLLSSSETQNNSVSRININSASLEELNTLPGVGDSTAQKIINNRPYLNISDLLNVSGIGDSKYEQIKNLVEI